MEQWAGILGTGLAVALLARSWLQRPLIERADYAVRPKRQFLLDLCLMFGLGLAIAGFNAITFGFPLFLSGSKAVLGLSVLGFFAAADLALERERLVTHELKRKGLEIIVSERLFPLTRKFTLLAAVSVVTVFAVTVLVINKDLLWLAGQEGAIDWSRANISVMKEIGFISFAMLLLLINLIHSYSLNLDSH